MRRLVVCLCVSFCVNSNAATWKCDIDSEQTLLYVAKNCDAANAACAFDKLIDNTNDCKVIKAMNPGLDMLACDSKVTFDDSVSAPDGENRGVGNSGRTETGYPYEWFEIWSNKDNKAFYDFKKYFKGTKQIMVEVLGWGSCHPVQ